MKKISVVTATRAEYGLLKPLILKLRKEDSYETQVVATGTHLLEEFGYTLHEIQGDGIPVASKIPITSKGDSEYDVSLTMANAFIGFGKYFAQEKPDIVILLGDRTETLAIAGAAMNARIPIAHIHGGELTKGAIDDCVRHALTKMSYLHFASAEVYKKRIIQMGEEPERVFNVGALGVENVLKETLLSRWELKKELEFPFDAPYVVVTFHPVTLEENTALVQMEELIGAMEEENQYCYLITKANADAGGRQMNKKLEQAVSQNSNMKLVSSLGMKRYLSAVKHAVFVMGNSSSGIIEVPALGIPTVNIGDRQDGRIMGESVVQCGPDRKAILKAMAHAVKRRNITAGNPYGDGTASDRIVNILKQYLFDKNIDLKKKFYDIPWGKE